MAKAKYKQASDAALADVDGQPDLHSTNVWLQLEYAASGGEREHGEHLELGKGLLELAMPAADTPTHFWDRSQLGDTYLTMALLNGDETSRADIGRATKHYVAAFENRSTIRERDSVRTHLDDLIAIFGSLPGAEAPGLALIKELRHCLPSS